MTLTTDHMETTETAGPAAPAPETSPTRRSGIVGWIAAGVALATAGLLAVAVLDNDTAEPVVRRNTVAQTVAAHGSVSAIEHREEQSVRPTQPVRRNTPSQTVAEHGSINAIEHRQEQPVQPVRRNTPSQTIAEHGSISAIEHRQLGE